MNIPDSRPRKGSHTQALRALTVLLALLMLAAALSGCAGVSVKPSPISQRFDALDRSAINSSRPSELTLAFLKQRDLAAQWESDPEGLIARLDEKYHAAPGPGTLFALVELSHLQAKSLASEPDKAARYDLSCALYAYLFLFDPRVAATMDYLRPNTRLAAEFHNRSLSRYLLRARAAGIRFQKGMSLPLAAGSLLLEERRSGLPFAPEEISDMHLAFEFAVSGLDVTYSLPGLGVPLILVRDGSARDDRPEDRFLPKVRQVVAATLFLRIDPEPGMGPGRESGPDSGGGAVYRCSLEFYDPMRASTVQVGSTNVPLESDTTTPLAWMAAHAKPQGGIKGLMDPEAMKAAQGLYMLQPYQADKIPVVFVHGLISSPMTWLPMINGLMGDPELRERYQFWYFSYPTGNPVFYSASLLRDSLEHVRRTYDPEGRNPAFNNMLIVGHSMGGLLSKAMVQDSGDRLWNLLTNKQPSELNLPQDVRELLNKSFFFKPLPFISEAVFISTPHRGSGMALGTIGSIGRALVTLPLTLAKAGATLLQSIGTPKSGIALEGLPTGIDSLSPKNPMLTTTAAMPVAVPFHSIIGNEDKAGVAGGTDGVVPYWSSHLDGAQTELIVKSGHGAHENPLAIREVRRIMLEHMRKNGEKPQ
ncbi:esterase/lipase family protein [Fundidesulfovibrio soli]|uniref:esterase/lipase family protein n=1 Tax=Fundidesulfovibrio soli TaxID=2922716 RepID=UPI001FAF9BB5|nr:alpha/beta hydrolase [Fundidesulfovibrio soli]